MEDQESEEVLNAGVITEIGSCGHVNCKVCKEWTSYPQSLFGNWTIKPIRKCGIERAVRGRDHTSTIYTVDVLENGVFGKSSEPALVTLDNKREYWSNVLKREVCRSWS